MNLSKQALINFLEGQDDFESDIDPLNPIQLAHLYINSALLVSVMDFIKEELWIKTSKDKELGIESSYKEFLTPFFNHELTALLFLKDFLIKRGFEGMKKIKKDGHTIEKKVLSVMTNRSNEEQKEFVTQSLKEMREKFLHEEKEQVKKDPGLGHQGPRLYRTFDNLDDIFKLDYGLDLNMIVDHSAKERLYERSGVGVQSGYSTILLALDGISPKKGCRMIDLGSGYGRVGLVCSLLRPDIEFIGYEYVPHRVEVSNKASRALGLEANLIFKTQDLSDELFQIPDADVYYLYDPFTKETYSYVLNQIIEISKRREVTIVTKGNARSWFVDIATENSWPMPIVIDEGNLCIFRSYF